MRWLVLLPFLATACWVTREEVQHKIDLMDEGEASTGDTGET